jgi:hypothetical protein
VHGLIFVAAVTPDNTPGGNSLTFFFPVGLFAVIATTLYLLFSRPHRRTPARRDLAPAHSGAPDPDAARAVAVAGGLPTAAGGGAAESHHEPAGATPAAESGAGSVSGQGDSLGDAGRSDRETADPDGTEGSE